jgi:hypothetical protein
MTLALEELEELLADLGGLHGLRTVWFEGEP